MFRWKSQVGSFPPVSHNKNEATFFLSSSRLKWLLIKLVVYQVFSMRSVFFCVLHVWVLYLEDVFKLLLDLVAGTTDPQVMTILLLGWFIFQGLERQRKNIDPFLAQERTCHQNQTEMINGDHVRFTHKVMQRWNMIFVEDSYNIFFFTYLLLILLTGGQWGVTTPQGTEKDTGVPEKHHRILGVESVLGW